MGGLPLSALRLKSNASSRLLVKFVPGMQVFVFYFARHAADDLCVFVFVSVSLSLCLSVAVSHSLLHSLPPSLPPSLDRSLSAVVGLNRAPRNQRKQGQVIPATLNPEPNLKTSIS
eukprot:3014859-Rhodomonas_salina.1